MAMLPKYENALAARSVNPPNPPLTTELGTPRLVLRPPHTGDVAAIRHLVRENYEHLRPWKPASSPGEDLCSITGVSNTVLRHRRDWKRGTGYVFFLTRRASKSPFIGKIALSSVVRGALQSAYLGYWVDACAQGQGLATEGVAAAIDFGFGPLGLHRIQAAIMPKNSKSLRVIEKAGFRREGYAVRYLYIGGVWEDHVIFARTREEYELDRASNQIK
ncbi:MAG: GNAT family N-acetyltransferase [Polyangiaceae bacterium]|nr:GNAT family N-acetyltransferase [Polyangiaceae bacterium]